ncbi:unnamed protein product [Vicia faba]|uniref:Homeobox domain-containing protein n=1 Tax=Vicia faba TaxID=3906 RepID=A0AAV0ZQ58_VICFA|nr:unnamed protein product [Vicia faba]
MYPNHSFSSLSYADMFTATPLLPHNYYNESVGEQNETVSVTMQSIDQHSNPCNSHLDCEQTIQCQGLSLSLGTLLPSTSSIPPFQYQYHDAGFVSLMNNACLPKGTTISNDDDLKSVECMTSISSGGFHDITKRETFHDYHHTSDQCLQGSPSGFANIFLNSQYLKAAQELLDEIVNVRKQRGIEKQNKIRGVGLNNSKDTDGKCTSQSRQISSGPNDSNSNSSSQLSSAERQNWLDTKTKLLSILDEVDKRYRQYCHQMQIVVSSLDMVAGCGAAEPYTTLALRTISRHFRCLRDAISTQIQLIQRNLGEQEGIPRLRYVDQHLRQQKELQQLGVTRHAWRPQRGLPENSVSILRAWLFEHFLNPYPKDSEKIMLARQTGLTRNQVANWFINARVRLWKPMVEEIYKEEFGDSEINYNNSSENPLIKGKRDYYTQEIESQDNVQTITIDGVHACSTKEHAMDYYESKKLHGGNERFSVKNGFYSEIACDTATYDLSEIGGGHHHNQQQQQQQHVSLSLELRNCESDGLAISDNANHKRHNINNNNINNQILSSSSGKQQHRFGNTHLLHEFVV